MKKIDSDLTNITIMLKPLEKEFIRKCATLAGKSITDFILDETIPFRKQINIEYEQKLSQELK